MGAGQVNISTTKALLTFQEPRHFASGTEALLLGLCLWGPSSLMKSLSPLQKHQSTTFPTVSNQYSTYEDAGISVSKSISLDHLGDIVRR